MVRLTLTQMRLNAGRLAAAGLAVLLGTAFVAATLLAGDLLKATIHDAVSASYRGADVVVTQTSVPASMLTAVRQLPQVDGADATDVALVELVAGSRSDTPEVGPVATTPALRTAHARSGRLPAAAGEIALSTDLAKRLQLAVGDRVSARTRRWSAATPNGSTVSETALTVVGLLAPGSGFGLDPDAVAVPAQLDRWNAEQGSGSTLSGLVAHAAPGVSQERARAAVAALPGWDQALIRTGPQQTEADTRSLTRGIDVLTGGLLGFAGVALFVAGLVIANTFQVLVAQRTRALALLRCVGATRRQIRRSVLLEAGLLGTAASVLGLLVGTALVMIAAAVMSSMDLRVAVPSTVRPGVASVLAPLAVGVLVTVLAALSPARAATRVSPVAALRPAMAADLRSRASVLRIVMATGLIVVGAGLLMLGVLVSQRNRGTAGLLPAVAGWLPAMAGGALSFLGVLVGGSLFIPRLVALFGRLFGRWGGVPGRVAAANAVRNPRRTATTSAALLIGVTLVATMSTGAAVLTATLDRQLDGRFPVDVMVGFTPTGVDLQSGDAQSGDAQPGIPPGVPPAVAKVPGVAGTALLDGGRAAITGASGHGEPLPGMPVQDPGALPTPGRAQDPGTTAGPDAVPTPWVDVQAVDPGLAGTVLHAQSGVSGLAPGRAVVPQQVATTLGVRDGDALTLSSGGHTLRVRAVVTPLVWDALLLTPQDLHIVLPAATPTMLWLRLDPSADVAGTVQTVKDTVVTATGSQSSVPVAGLAVERATYQAVISTLLLIVTGLLAVAVVIALIGVANTLSLSVIERTRESAVLRALGLTRRQLRAMLAVEGALIAGIGALVGIVLGVVYGWAGATSLIGGVWRPELVLPWRDLALLLAGGVLAGLAASVLPGRRAARTAPVTALAE